MQILTNINNRLSVVFPCTVFALSQKTWREIAQGILVAQGAGNCPLFWRWLQQYPTQAIPATQQNYNKKSMTAQINKLDVDHGH